MESRSGSCTSNRRPGPDCFPVTKSSPAHLLPDGSGDGDDGVVVVVGDDDDVAADLAKLEVGHSEKDCQEISEVLR